MSGTVESLWRYPVKSMRGEELATAVVEAGGVQGDRLFAFTSSAAPAEFPYFTAREQRYMLQYRPRFRTDATQLMVDVETPSGERLAIDDPQLIAQLRSGADARHQVTLMRSERPITDAYPISIISLQTVRKLEAEISAPTDKRQFRANIYVDLPGTDGFGENEFVGRKIRIGTGVVLSVAERDTRCQMITLHPDTSARTPALFKQVTQVHDGAAGVYASVVTAGSVGRGDPVVVLD